MLIDIPFIQHKYYILNEFFYCKEYITISLFNVSGKVFILTEFLPQLLVLFQLSCRANCLFKH